jgi:hypothetical protein
MKATRRYRKRRNRSATRRRRGGRLGSIPAGAIVAIQQDAYSPTMLVDAETAENIFESRGHYLL